MPDPQYTPGWYTPDGAPPEKQRYFNGTQWTEHWRDTPKGGSVIGWGYVCAILIGPIGVILGIIAMVKGRVGHGILILLISFVSMSLSLSYFASREDTGTFQYQSPAVTDSDNDGVVDDLDDSPYDAAP
jgi:hypothetical protein